jgi:hypothetical protein
MAEGESDGGKYGEGIFKVVETWKPGCSLREWGDYV